MTLTKKEQLAQLKQQIADATRDMESLSAEIKSSSVLDEWQKISAISAAVEKLLSEKLNEAGISRRAYNNADEWYDYSIKLGNRYITAVEGETGKIANMRQRSGKTDEEMRQDATARKLKMMKSKKRNAGGKKASGKAAMADKISTDNAIQSMRDS
jgi:hypothetical protein